MKRTLLYPLFFIYATASAQIIVHTNSQWQQYIPLITGGQSIQISNIYIQGHPDAFGYYQAPNHELGLTQGIIMTTGYASGPSGPLGPNNIPNCGLDNGTPSHFLASQIAGLSACFNSSVIEFDFSSPVQDTLQLKYLFGSEEYKEYVGSQFNDIFGFFVTAGPGISTPVNIALVPGTTTPIAINNVNHINNTTYFHDNEIIPGAEIQYDGYVSLVTEPFAIEPNQVYHIVLLVSDVGDGIYDSGVFLELMAGKQNLCGQIFYEGLPAGPGTVELIGYRINEPDMQVLDTAQTNANGEFSFDSVEFGGYILRSVLNPVDYPLAYPVYIDSAVIWNLAHIQYMPTIDTSCKELHHKELPVGSGPGTISGSILNDNLIKIIGPISEMTPCYIFAMNQNNEVAAYSKINLKGEYALEGLDEGTYTLLIDYLNYSMIDTNWINISTNSYTHHANYLAKNKEKQIYRLLTEPVTSNDFYNMVYPNPSTGDFTLFIHSPEFLRELDVYVSDLRGRVIFSQTVSAIPEGQSFYRFDLTEANPAPGVYIIRMQSEGYTTTTKILIE
jgi:hypothetical protein